jgi:hypothetical protein
MTTPVTPEFRNLILEKYPALRENSPYLRFFAHLCFSTFRDAESERLVVPTRMIAEEFYGQTYHPSFNGKAKLEALRDEVLPGLTWSEYDPQLLTGYKGKAREIVSTGFDDETQQALRAECLSSAERKVDLVTGRAFQRQDRYRRVKDAREAYENDLAAFSLNKTQKSVLEYLQGVNYGHLVLQKVNENAGAIEHAIGQLPPKLRDIQRRIIKAVYEDPTVYYLPSSEERTCRLSARGDTVLGLKKQVRRAATRGWVECDLRNSQFAILAAKLNAPVAQALIASGKTLWREFYGYTHGIDAEPPGEVKSIFKEAIYSLCFGKSERNLKRFLKENGIGSLVKHPVMEEMLDLREQWLSQIERDGGAPDVWGAWQAIDTEIDPATGKATRWAGSVAAAVIQSVELEIIAPIFDVARKHGDSDQFKIALFQHDGATISFHSTEKQPRAERKLKEAVENRAKALGVHTVLEFSPL